MSSPESEFSRGGRGWGSFEGVHDFLELAQAPGTCPRVCGGNTVRKIVGILWSGRLVWAMKGNFVTGQNTMLSWCGNVVANCTSGFLQVDLQTLAYGG